MLEIVTKIDIRRSTMVWVLPIFQHSGTGHIEIAVFVLRLIMAALCSRCGHYIFALWFLLLSFFPRLISAVADWMCIILLYMTWP